MELSQLCSGSSPTVLGVLPQKCLEFSSNSARGPALTVPRVLCLPSSLGCCLCGHSKQVLTAGGQGLFSCVLACSCMFSFFSPSECPWRTHSVLALQVGVRCEVCISPAHPGQMHAHHASIFIAPHSALTAAWTVVPLAEQEFLSHHPWSFLGFLAGWCPGPPNRAVASDSGTSPM